MASLLLDVGHWHRILFHHVHRIAPLADSLFPRQHGSGNNGAVEVLRVTDRIMEHAGLRHGIVYCDPDQRLR